MEPYWKSVTELLDKYCDNRVSSLQAENDSLKIKLANAQERYVKLLKEYEDYKKRIKKARIKHEKSFDKVFRQWDNNYWELDQVIMNR